MTASWPGPKRTRKIGRPATYEQATTSRELQKEERSQRPRQRPVGVLWRRPLPSIVEPFMHIFYFKCIVKIYLIY